MTITITNLTVAQNAPAGTIVGVLSARDVGSIIPCNFILSKKASGYFAISTNNLVTVWNGSIAPGYYCVRVRAVGTTTRFSGNATFDINVIDPSSLPTPTGIIFVTTTASLPDNSPAGTTVATLSVATSDGSPFTGILGASPAGVVAISGTSTLVLARALISTDDGSHQWGVTATQNGVTVSSSVTVQVIRPSQPPPPAPPPPLPPAVGWDPAFNAANFTLSTALAINDRASHSANAVRENIRSAIALPAAKVYLEYLPSNMGANDSGEGICDSTVGAATALVNLTNCLFNKTAFGYVGAGSGTRVEMAIDNTSNKVAWFRVNGGAWVGNGTGTPDPNTPSTGLSIASLVSPLYALFSSLSLSEQHVLVTAGNIVHSPPTGYTAFALPTAPSGVPQTFVSVVSELTPRRCERGGDSCGRDFGCRCGSVECW